MDQPRNAADAVATWEQEVQTREEEACAAFLKAELATLDRLGGPGYLVNPPLQQVLEEAKVLALLQTGRFRPTLSEYEIEQIARRGDVVVVMGSDRVADSPDGTVSRRRFTNVWQLEHGQWRSGARHAHGVARKAAD